MAANPNLPPGDLKDLASSLKEINRASSSTVRSLKTLESALEEAGSKAVGQVTAKLIDLAKQSSILTSELKDGVKDTKSAVAALSTISTMGPKIKELTQTFIDNKNAAGRTAKEIASANRAVVKELAKLGISVDANSKDLGNKLASLSAEVDLTGRAMNDASKELSSASSNLGKAFDDQSGRLFKSAANFATLDTALKLATRAAISFYDAEIKLANRGMLATAAQTQLTATKFNMSMDETIDMFDKNRDVILSLGGGAQGIENFKDQVSNASKGLEYLGKDGKKAAAQFVSTFNRAGASADEYAKLSEGVNEQFRKSQSMFGTSSEQFAEYYDELFKGSQIQGKLNMGDLAGAEAMRKELVARTANLTVLGISTTKLTEMNKTLEGMYNPKKNSQGEEMKKRMFQRMSMETASSDLRATGDKDDASRADEIDKGIKEKDEYDKASLADKKDLTKFTSYRKAVSTTQGHIATSQNGDATSFNGYLSRELADKAGPEFSLTGQTGDAIKDAERRKQNQKPNQDNSFKGSGADVGPDGKLADTAETQTVEAARYTVEKVQALLSTPMGKATEALGAFTAALLGSAAASAMGGAGGIAKGAGTIAKGAGSMLAGGAGLLGGGLAVAGAGAAGYYGAKTLLGAAGYDGSTIGGAAMSMLGPKDPMAVMAAQDAAKRRSGTSGSLGAPSTGGSISSMPKSSSGKSSAKDNEAAMSKALDDAGISDPKQKAILMGQLAHESGGFKYTKELGSGNKYEGRKDLGNTEEGDGDKYKGRGFIQLTGKANYAAAGQALGLDLVNQPELAEQPDIASKIAVWYLQNHKKRDGTNVMDAAASGDVTATTKMINGGTNGLQDRMQRTNSYMAQYAANGTGASSTGTQYAQIDKSSLAAAAGGMPPGTATAMAATPDSPLEIMKQQTAILTRIASNTTKQIGRDVGKVDKRTAVEG
jgi:predicted chitinase